jgi:hypothetical protein
MYEYKFVRIEVPFGFLGTKQNPSEDYQELVRQHAQEGWRFVQIFAPGTHGSGDVAYFELIFEKSLVQSPR